MLAFYLALAPEALHMSICYGDVTFIIRDAKDSLPEAVPVGVTNGSFWLFDGQMYGETFAENSMEKTRDEAGRGFL